ncbi:hypothetical protein OH76DRAFT_1408741 [Lentinus brumalis]|uniref:Uncharacterized protein n=1 Tax=Lentinus brumalis TaxID=2498619 RepID=A0A371CX26_9APHY|nr:hypothetical protein OH76DRAFT_1408741 [Polyporus brumalis]
MLQVRTRRPVRASYSLVRPRSTCVLTKSCVALLRTAAADPASYSIMNVDSSLRLPCRFVSVRRRLSSQFLFFDEMLSTSPRSLNVRNVVRSEDIQGPRGRWVLFTLRVHELCSHRRGLASQMSSLSDSDTRPRIQIPSTRQTTRSECLRGLGFSIHGHYA